MRRFWTCKRLTVMAAGLLAAAVAVPAVTLLAGWWQSRQTLAAVLDRLDRDDPGWRLDDIVRATNAKLPPDDRNPFILATAANDLLPADYRRRSLDLPDWSKSAPNVLLDPVVKAKLLAAMRGMEPALDVARDLADLPDVGGNIVVIPADPMRRLMQREEDLRLTAALLRADAVLLTEEGKTGEAVRSVRAALGTARAVGDDPSLIGQQVRSALGAVAVRAAESVVNLGEPDAGLAELQAEFLQEAVAPRLLVGLRGERASGDRLMVEVLPPRRYGRIDRATFLDMLTRMIEASSLPLDRRAAALRAVPGPSDDERRCIVTALLIYSSDRACNSILRSQGELAAVAVGLACERHRRRSGQWPATLGDIPKDILAALPVDPCDGLPLKYQRLDGRVVVYSVGPDATDDGGLIRDFASATACDYGIRLYDVPLRRQPASPPAVEPDPFAPDEAVP